MKRLRSGNKSAGESEGEEGNLNSWLQLLVRYEGQGKVEFAEPHGFALGPTWVEFEETGVARAEMQVESIESDDDLPLGNFQFFRKDRPIEEGGTTTLSLGLDSEPNDCIRLVVETSDGRFFANKPISYSHKHADPLAELLGEPSELALRFQLFNGLYEVRHQTPRFWVLPLTNFVSEVGLTNHSLAEHPLKIRMLPSASDPRPDRERIQVHLMMLSTNKVIPFEYRGLPAHIELLNDYDDRRDQLLNGRARRLVTAVMVGDLPPSRLNK
jgi:hypothetical protein